MIIRPHPVRPTSWRHPIARIARRITLWLTNWKDRT